jgi:predicted acyltransferase (DUF342 family)
MGESWVTSRENPGASLTIGTDGIIEGSVRVDSLVLNGAVTGDVTANERVELGSTAKVDGNVVYKTLQMAEGARVNGRLIHQASAAAGGGAVRRGHGAGGRRGPRRAVEWRSNPAAMSELWQRT